MMCKKSVELLGVFVKAELFRLWRSRVSRAALVTPALGCPVAIAVLWLLGDDRYRTFPQVTELIYLPSWLIVGLVAVLLVVDAVGREFEQGTARTVVGRGTPRWLFVSGKALALLVAVAIGASAATICGAACAGLSHLLQAGTAGLADGLGEFLRSWPLGLGVLALEAMAYAGVMVLGTVLVRSSTLSTLAGLLLFGGDFSVSALGLGEPGLKTWSIMGNAGALLTASALANSPGLLAPPVGVHHLEEALLALTLYAIAGVGGACYLFRRQDLAPGL
jgi:ABC-type transport system involved in multi-copper enzyme maturation permease subunit